MGGLLDPNTIAQMLQQRQNQMLDLVQQRQNQQRAAEEKRLAEERAQSETLLFSAIDQGASPQDILKLSGLLPPNSVPPGLVGGAQTLAKLKQQERKRAEAEAQLPGQAEQFQQSRQAQPGLEDVLAQLRGVEQTAGQAGRDPAQVLAQLSTAGQIDQAKDRQIATEQTPEQLAARARENRMLAQQRAAESRAVGRQRDEELVGTVTSLLADDLIRQNPELPSRIQTDPNELERISEGLRAQGVSENQIDRTVRRAQTLALDAARRRVAQARSAAGTKETQDLVEAEMVRLREQYPEAEIRRNDVVLMLNGRLTLDPFSEEVGEPIFARTQGTTDQSKFLETRRGQRGLLLELDRLEDAFTAMREDVSAGRARFVGQGIPEPVTRELENLGFGTASVARYRQVRFQLISSILKATQGSRPSDFDLRMYMALLPFTAEALSETAPAKIEGLRESMMLQVQALSDPRLRREIERRRAAPESAAWRRIESQFEALRDPETGGLREGVTDAEIDAVFQATQTWQQTEGGRFRLPGVGEPAEPLSEPARKWAERNLGGAP